jgi:hypothetical protein
MKIKAYKPKVSANALTQQYMPTVNLVYRIQFILIKYECEPFTQAEIDSLIYH